MTYEAPYSERGPIVLNTLNFHGHRFRGAQVASAPASAAWPTNNKAILIPFQVAGPTLITEMFFTTGTAPGTANFDLGIYDDQFALLVSLGATACVNTTDAIMPAGGGDITDTWLARGRYYMAMSAAATTITTRANTYGNGFLRAVGCQMATSSHPLPATITPTALTDAYLPVIGMAAITNVL